MSYLPPTGPALQALEAIATGNHGDPFAVLGAHAGPGGIHVTCFQPHATSVRVLDAGGREIATLERVHPAGIFSGPIGRDRLAYRLAPANDGGSWIEEDPYRFGPVLSDYDIHLLGEGTHTRSYERMGAHPAEQEGVAGISFAVWAPNARRVSVIGDWNGWDGRRHPMRLRREAGIWEIFMPGVEPGALYKFELLGPDGQLLPEKSDPYAFYCEQPPHHASIVWPLPAPAQRPEGGQGLDQPVSIYEVHLGSWKRSDGNRYLSYRALADQLVPYVQEMGFTHIELMPVSEHPFDGSWGYQPTNMFAPTSRFGSPDDFRLLVDRAHQAGLRVLLDWVPGHFPNDAHGLGHFDGTHLYEHADPRLGKHMDWDTLIYNFGRTEVANFLLSNAAFWIDRYGIDGLRVDAVASMIYRNYSRREGEWIPNQHGGVENLEATSLLRRVNELVFGRYPGATTVAEESTAWPGVSRPTSMGGLGFGYKWNMGWMHDTLGYMAQDPVHRRFHHDQMTFGLVYAFTESFVLPLSHDEVVHGKGSLLQKMPGDRWQKFANLRAYYGFMYGHPGKKLLFMGGELAQDREWNHDRSLDWHLLEDPMHRGVQSLVRDLNHLYRELPALHALDCEGGGFEWLDLHARELSVFAFLRRGRHARERAVVVTNMTPVAREGFRVGVPDAGWWRERLNTDAEVYGGSNIGNGGGVAALAEPHHGQPCSMLLTLPPLSTVVLTFEG